ncbi:MAG: histidine--tRNA ligase, partial [Thermoplasmata archaeon]
VKLMEEKIKKLRGFRELYPEEMEARAIIFKKMKEISRNFNFKEIDTPSVEPLDLFKMKSGEEIVSQTFSFIDKGNREITLVPEITPIVARMVAQRKNMIKPIKWYSIPKLWRYEEPQSGRLREFYQYNADIFGISGVEADAEIIALSQAILESLGLRDKYIMRISDRLLMEEILKNFKIKEVGSALRLIDRMEKIGENKFKEEFEKISKDVDIMEFIKLKGDLNLIEKKLDGIIGESILNRLRNLEEYLKEYDYGNFIFDLSIVRGIAYYTGIVFEAHDYKGELRAILGGGRYDNVVSLFDGENVPAVGFGMGDAVLEILMKRENLWPNVRQRPDYFIAIQGNARKLGIIVAKSLREKGYIVDLDLSNKPLSNQMKYADKIESKYVIIIGENEMKKNIVNVREMESGKQIEIKVEDLLKGYKLFS